MLQAPTNLFAPVLMNDFSTKLSPVLMSRQDSTGVGKSHSKAIPYSSTKEIAMLKSGLASPGALLRRLVPK